MTVAAAAETAAPWSADLEWVLEALWGHSGEVQLSPLGELPANRRSVDSFALFPTPKRPRLMVPLGSGRAASQAVHDHDTHKKVVRVAKAVLAGGLRSGLGRRLIRHGLTVSVADDTPAGSLPRLLLKEHLREVMGRPDIETAIKFNSLPPHRKPTLQLLSREGQVLAYAKVGWNDLTRALVRTEAGALARLSAVSGFEVPRVIHAGRWRDTELLVLEPLARGPWYRRRPPLRTPPIAAMQEIATFGDTDHGRLIDSAYWAQTRERIAATERTLGQSPLGACVERLERRFGELTPAFGWWHGDWVPWNMGYVRDRLYVWDWERSGPLAPLGLDALHFEYQAALGIAKLAPLAGAHRVLEGSGSSLPALGVSEELRPLLLCLHLLEMALRFEEGRALGIELVDRKYRPPLEQLLR